MEVSSHGLDQGRLAGVTLAVACVTNVRRDHLDFHGTLATYQAAKGRLFGQLRDGGVAVTYTRDGELPPRRYGWLGSSEASPQSPSPAPKDPFTPFWRR